MDAIKKIKGILRGIAAKGVNLIPVSSTLLGSPRSIVFLDHIISNSTKYLKISDSEAIIELAPKTCDENVFFKFKQYYNREQPKSFIVEIENGRVWGNNGAIISQNDELIADLSVEFGPAKFNADRHSIFKRVLLGPMLTLKGRWAVIASPGADVYAHWFADVLPRLYLVQKMGLLQNIDGIILNYSGLDFQVDSLSRMGISSDLILNCKNQIFFHAKADSLVVPSYVNQHATVNKWVCEWIRSLYTFKLGKLGSSFRSKRIYISRVLATGRQLIDENAIVQVLVKDFGFECIKTEELKMEEKVGIFSNAEFIIGPHGGGLTNILFSKPGCVVIDIFPPGDFDTFYWTIANSLNLEYHYFFGKGELPTIKNDFVRRNVDIDIDRDLFFSYLRKLIN